MTDDNSNLVDMDDLDAFENSFFNREPVATDKPEEEVKEEEALENEDDALATDEDTDASEETAEDDEPEDEEPKEEPKPKAKKSFQDRIDELTRGKREAERRESDLLRRLEALEARKTEDDTKPEPKPLRQQLPAEAPNPDAVDEDGEPIYKLGEFDPQYIRDLTKFTIAEESKAAKETAEKARQQSEVEAAQEELKSSWLEKVDAAAEELPDLRDKLATMGEAFEGIDHNYGEFLAATIMSCDYGPQIMYYLSQNIGEAQKIVASGPASATLAIGRLDARFTKAPKAEEKRNPKKVSDAPKPPAAMSRGSGGRFSVAGDTDDLDAFQKVFFNRK